MDSVQTKEASPALIALSKAKGRKAIGTVAQPVAVMVENKGTPQVLATPAQAPETPATPVQTPEPIAQGRDYEKAWKELKSHHDKTTYELRQTNAELEAKLVNQPKPELKLPKTKEEIQAWRKQFPEAGDIITSIAMETADTKINDLNRKIEEVNKLATKLSQKEAFADLLKIHPDALVIKESPEFEAWFNQQPDEIKHIMARSTDINAVAKQLSLYKLEVLGVNPKEKAKEKTKEAVDASLGVNVNSRTEITAQKKIWTKTEIDHITSDYNRWYKVKDELDLARREGRVDLTK